MGDSGVPLRGNFWCCNDGVVTLGHLQEGGAEAGVQRKAKQAKEAPLAFSTKQAGPSKLEIFRHEGNRALQQSTDQGATRTLETETQFDRDAR